MTTDQEKECMKLFKYGYFDTVLSARCGLPLEKVKELRVVYTLFKAKRR